MCAITIGLPPHFHVIQKKPVKDPITGEMKGGSLKGKHFYIKCNSYWQCMLCLWVHFVVRCCIFFVIFAECK